MDPGKLVFAQLMDFVPRHDFDACVRRHGGDSRPRGFSCRDQFLCMAFAQLTFRESLRDIETCLRALERKLYHAGFRSAVARSTLADANRYRPSALFSDLFTLMVGRLQRSQRRSLAEATLLVDASVLPLPARSAGWARFSAVACGAKMHVVYDPDADQPIYCAVTAAHVNDITAAQSMPIEAGATYVFDLGYYDYRWWAALHQAGCRIVTRLKSNTPLAVIEQRAVAARHEAWRATDTAKRTYRGMHAAGGNRPCTGKQLLRFAHDDPRRL